MTDFKNICKININQYKSNRVLTNPDQVKWIEDIFSVFKTTKVQFIKVHDKEYLLKKEYFIKNYPLLHSVYKLLDFNIDEYTFYKKYTKKIIEYKLNSYIQLPYQYKICKQYSLYIFTKIDFDLTSIFLRKINTLQFNHLLQQCIYIIYFLNHVLHIFHNDLHQDDKIRNFMYIQNKDKKKKLSLYDQKIEILDYQLILIDFGLYNKKSGLKNNLFYNTKTIKYMYYFEIQSELLIILYVFLINYYIKKEIHFQKLYLYYYHSIKNKNIKEFDRAIFDQIKDIDTILSLI